MQITTHSCFLFQLFGTRNVDLRDLFDPKRLHLNLIRSQNQPEKYHNLLAAEIHEENPNLSDEDIFQTTKRRIVGHLQKITLYDWLPHYVNLDQVQFLTSNDPSNSIPRYQGHNPSASPDLRLEFSMAMRAGLSSSVFKSNIRPVHTFFARRALNRTLNGTKGNYSEEKRTSIRKWHKLQLGIGFVCFGNGTKCNHQTC